MKLVRRNRVSKILYWWWHGASIREAWRLSQSELTVEALRTIQRILERPRGRADDGETVIIDNRVIDLRKARHYWHSLRKACT